MDRHALVQEYAQAFEQDLVLLHPLREASVPLQHLSLRRLQAVYRRL